MKERVFKSFPIRWRENDPYGLGVLTGQVAGLKIWLITKLRHGLSYLFFCVPADGRVILAGSGNCGRRNPR